MGNPNRNCRWPYCECQTEQGDPCKYEDPDFYINLKSTQNDLVRKDLLEEAAINLNRQWNEWR